MLRAKGQVTTGFSPYRPRATWLVMMFAIAGLVFVNGVWLLPALRDVGINAGQLRLAVAGRAADTVENFIRGKSAALQHGASALRFAAKEEEKRAVLDRILKENPEFLSLTLLDEALVEEIKASRLELVTKADLRTRPDARQLFDEAIERGLAYGAVSRTENLEPAMLVASALVRGGKDYRPAILMGELKLTLLSELISRFRFGASGKVYFVDSEGFLITDPDLSLVLRHPNLREREVVVALLERGGEVALSRYNDLSGIEREASGTFLTQLKWAVVAEQSREEVNALRNRIILLASLSFGIGLALILLLLANSRALVRAIERLHRVLIENYESAKMLVRRDRELVATNNRLQELLEELENVGKMLVRRDLDLSRANTRLEELDHIKSEFVSIAAHQLRTPLTGVRWSYQTLLDRDGATFTYEQRRLLKAGLGATFRMIDLVNDLLSVARIEEGRFGIRLQRHALAPLIEQLAGRYAILTKEKGISLAVQVPDADALGELMFDEEKLMLVLDNILDNALKYTEPGGAITLSAKREADRVRIEVKDTGVGIPKGQLHRVFSKFFRADNAIRLHTSGTGLGLYVAKNIIENHDGTIEVKSTEGKGSVFSFTLPIVA